MKNITVLIMDSTPDKSGDVFDPNGVTIPDEVPLIHGFGKEPEAYLGKAKLRREGDRVVADLEFQTDRIMNEKLDTVEGCREIIEFYNGFEKTHDLSFGEKKLVDLAVDRLKAEAVRKEHQRLFAERGNVVSLELQRAVRRCRGK